MINTHKALICLLMLSTQLGFAQDDLVFFPYCRDHIEQDNSQQSLEDLVYNYTESLEYESASDAINKIKAYENSDDEAYLAAEARIREIDNEAKQFNEELYLETLNNAEQDMIMYMEETGQATDGSESDDWALHYLAVQHAKEAEKEASGYNQQAGEEIYGILSELPTPLVEESTPVESEPQEKELTTIWLC